MQPVRQTTNEATIAAPAGLLFGTVLSVAALVAVAWWLIASLSGQPVNVQVSGVVGSAIAGIVGVLGLFAMGPWKTRPISGWMTMWLLATVIRVFVTPAVTFLLYSSASLNAFALTLSVASAYLAVLLAEAVVLARHVSQVVGPRPADASGSAGIHGKNAS